MRPGGRDRRTFAVSEAFRIAGKGRVDLTTPLSFTFNGRPYRGYRGDTLASALLANGVRLVGRSFKYHRPRGIFTASSEEPSALVQLEEGARTEPNARATMIELYEGLSARSQNCWPSVEFDVGAINGVLPSLLPAGFYYKTFMWPRGWWKRVYEQRIRKAAGMGRAPAAPDPDRYGQRYSHCDVLVAGAGPAGLAAALAAGRAGARVIIADEHAEPGGRLLSGAAEVDGRPALDWVADAMAELAAMPEATMLPRTTVCGYYDHGYLIALERVTNHLGPRSDDRMPRERLWRIRAKQVVIAAGAIERPVVFAGNDRPGTMLAGAVRTYLNRFGVLPGRDIVVFTNNDSAYRTALDVRGAGARVGIVDMRPNPAEGVVAEAEKAGIVVRRGHAIVATAGRKALRGCEIARLNADASAVVGKSRWLTCDVIAASAGWSPTVSLWSQAGGALDWDGVRACFRPAACSQPVRAAGACNGTFALSDCLVEGARAGALAACDAGFDDGEVVPPAATNNVQGPTRCLFTVPGRVEAKRSGTHFCDIQNDVTAADIHLAAREGYRSIEHLKRYTTVGMGTDQGKTSNVNALATMAEIRDIPVAEVGVTTFRPPYMPITFGAIVGQSRGPLFAPQRTTPMHSWHARHGAVLVPAGGWLRPWAYLRTDELDADAVQRECAAVRESVGLFDASTLGKIDIQGPDAAVLLDRVYTNTWSNLGIGRCRYGLMLDEQGLVMDDGVTTRLGERHFHLTATTGGAERVMTWLEQWLQTEWPELKVYLTDVTQQWAVAVLCGPRARDLLQRVTGIGLDGGRFPFMSYRTGEVAGVPARVFRVSFSGELSYEINVPARYGLHLWQALAKQGQRFGLCPFGTEALHVLRAERGFIVVGQDTDGTVTPMDLGLDAMIGSDKGDFIGKRSLARKEFRRAGRRQLVGLSTKNPSYVLPQGVHLVETPRNRPPMKTLGHVTSSYMSPNLGCSIALALVEDGRRRFGETLKACTREGHVEPVEVRSPVFFDPQGVRARG